MEEPKQDDTKTTAPPSGGTATGSASSASEPMQVRVYSPFKTYYEGEATSVSASSATGPFDVLAGHHNFITLLVPCDIIIRTAHGDQTITVAGGIMHVKADRVVVFLDI